MDIFNAFLFSFQKYNLIHFSHQNILLFRLIDEERKSNVIDETDKVSTEHQKRSISQFQSASIVGVYPTYEQVSVANADKTTSKTTYSYGSFTSDAFRCGAL